MLAAILTALLLGACGGSSEPAATGEPAESGAPASGAQPNAWNNVNEPLRDDILSFGEEGNEAELGEATAVLRDYLDARTDGNSIEVCSYLSAYMLSRAKGMAARQGDRGCGAGIESLETISSVDEIEGSIEVNPTSIRRKGPRTFVIYEDGYGDTYAMLMRHEEGAWRIHGFEPTRLT